MHDEDVAVSYFCGYFAVMLVLEANNFNASKEWEEHMQDHCSWLIVAAVLTPPSSSLSRFSSLACQLFVSHFPHLVLFRIERSMVRPLKEVLAVDGSGGGVDGSCLVLLWAVLLTLCLLSAIVFSCAEGVSKDKTSEADSTLYGGGCGAGCGAACGG
ncbi:hypothetical protein NC652_029404 [Populus alba x Populus x berolinensis]|nr:hypothetical protein NC652_029404 [Populus alba x Populus x berolinensis]